MLESLFQSVFHPSELLALFKVLCLGGQSSSILTSSSANLRLRCAQDQELQWCYDTLQRVSRSFSRVIFELPDELQDPICCMYLVLRALDTIEDDPKIPIEKKTRLLVDFHSRLTTKDPPQFELDMHDTNEYEKLLIHFDRVISVFSKLQIDFQTVILDTAQVMGSGMAEFVTKSISTIEDWDRYCYFVAGVVGEGLTRMMIHSGLEDSSLQQDNRLAVSMGLFLQKTNICRDYLEDVNEGRVFWPRQIWSQFAHEISDFKREENSSQALCCLNSLITNALEHCCDSLEYLSRLHNPRVFVFCAVPQVMAIATLALCFNNPQVFRQVVKIRKGLAAKLMETRDMRDVRAHFNRFAREIQIKIPVEDPIAETTCNVINRILECTATPPNSVVPISGSSLSPYFNVIVTLCLMTPLIMWFSNRKSNWAVHARI